MSSDANTSNFSQGAKRIPAFDPELAPIVARDSHLPVVSEQFFQVSGFRERFSEKKLWNVELTDENRSALSAQGAAKAGRGYQPTPAAVLIPMVAYADELRVLLTKRTSHLHDHPGQISFPGGRTDPEDLSPEHTALREAEEEVGLPSHQVEVLGCLPQYLTITGYQVTPVVALVEPGCQYRPDEFEVAEIFEVPLSFLMNPHHHEHRMWQSPEGERRFYSMPYENKFIWGATAGMLRNLYHFLRA
jgi:8-oxo-dGTP pyrophosphatase MutT (NUDIX family)